MGKPTILLSTGLLLLTGCTVPTGTNAPASASAPSQPGPSATAAAPGGQAADAATPAELADSVFFPADTADLTPEARRALKGWADRLRTTPAPVTVVGHGDEHSTREYAIALGAKRAAAVKTYLVALGVPPERVAITTFGAERPAMPGVSEEAQALDRRAVLQFESLAVVPQP